LKKVLDALPANVFGEGRAVPVEREERIADAGIREGALVEKDGGLFTVSDGALVKPEWADKPKKVRQAASYVGVKKSVFDLINKTETLFENPETGLIEPDDIYLSGNVRKKLEMAEAGREDNPAYGKNVEALRKVQPERIGIDAIHARIGSSWVPAKVYEAFVKHLGFSSVSVEKARLEGEDGSTQWHVEAYGGTPEARNRWGVDGASVIDLISDSLNLKRTEVYDEHYNADGKTSRVKNTEKTLAAQEKQRSIQNEFQSWLKKDDAAGRLVEDEYNDRFNGFVPRKFTAPDIKHFPGASHAIELRENQKIGVIQGLQESTLLAHGVGSGKTMLQITLAMEMRRLGTAKKPWIVVQASSLSQFAATFKTLYPRAAMLVAALRKRGWKDSRPKGRPEFENLLGKINALRLDTKKSWAYVESIAEKMYGVRIPWLDGEQLGGVIAAMAKHQRAQERA